MDNLGYEKKDIPVKPVLIGGLIFVITVLGTIYLLYEYYVRVLDDATYEFKPVSYTHLTLPTKA